MWRLLSSPGVAVIAVLCVIASLLVAWRPSPTFSGNTLWTFSRNLDLIYREPVAQWNRENPDNPLRVSVIDFNALERRLLSGFLSETPLAELVETERGMVGRTFLGPLEAVGFTDLTDRLRSEGLDQTLNPPSFSPWMSRGRIFGLPHDVHPVLLAYRADLIEAAGIDLTQAETWEDLERLLRPMQQDLDGDGRLDRYAMSFWFLDPTPVEALILQGDGQIFDAEDRPTLDHPRNAELLCRLALWIGGPRRIALDAPNFTAAGSQMRLQGNVLCSLMPDWLAGAWMNEQVGLAGKMKLMPLPAWEKGGRRTSVWGGTMLGIPKATKDFERAWAIAKHLYLGREVAETTFRTNAIITPVRSLWQEKFFDEPKPFFRGQPIGRLYIEQAPFVPRRTSSAYARQAANELTDVLRALARRAESEGIVRPQDLAADAQRLLREAQARIVRSLSRNVFLRETAIAHTPTP